MKHFLLITILSLANLFIGFSQNLVPNPSFENFDSCNIFGSGGIDSANGWWDIGSADLFNSCQTNPCCTSPSNVLIGHQAPYDGNGYAGIITYSTYTFPSTGGNCREYAQVKLISPLQSSVEYYVSFWVSFFDEPIFQNQWCASDGIGAYFSRDTLFSSTSPCNFIDSIPQIICPIGIPLSDTLNWTKISGSFVAKGGESYMTIGNFIKDSLLTTLCGNTPYPGTGYHGIDAVCVSTDSLTCYNFVDNSNLINDSLYLTYPNVFTPNGDGENDNFVIPVLGYHNIKNIQVQVFNRWGQLINNTEFGKLNSITATDGITELVIWDGTTNAAATAPQGTYFYTVTYTTTNDETFTEKSYLTLFR